MLLNEVDAALWDAAAESADSLAAATPPWAGESLAGTSQSDRPIGPLLARLRSSLELLTVAEPGLEDLLRTLVEAVHTLAARDSAPAKPAASPEPSDGPSSSPLPPTTAEPVAELSSEPAHTAAAELSKETAEALEDAAELVALLDDEQYANSAASEEDAALALEQHQLGAAANQDEDYEEAASCFEAAHRLHPRASTLLCVANMRLKQGAGEVASYLYGVILAHPSTTAAEAAMARRKLALAQSASSSSVLAASARSASSASLQQQEEAPSSPPQQEQQQQQPPPQEQLDPGRFAHPIGPLLFPAPHPPLGNSRFLPSHYSHRRLPTP